MVPVLRCSNSGSWSTIGRYFVINPKVINKHKRGIIIDIRAEINSIVQSPPWKRWIKLATIRSPSVSITRLKSKWSEISTSQLLKKWCNKIHSCEFYYSVALVIPCQVSFIASIFGYLFQRYPITYWRIIEEILSNNQVIRWK